MFTPFFAAMQTRQQIITLIDAYLSKTEMSERAFGQAVAGDHKFLRRLRSGAGVTLTLIEKAERFMDENPDGPPAPSAQDNAA